LTKQQNLDRKNGSNRTSSLWPWQSWGEEGAGAAVPKGADASITGSEFGIDLLHVRLIWTAMDLNWLIRRCSSARSFWKAPSSLQYPNLSRGKMSRFLQGLTGVALTHSGWAQGAGAIGWVLFVVRVGWVLSVGPIGWERAVASAGGALSIGTIRKALAVCPVGWDTVG
jgi:hypothetical protein